MALGDVSAAASRHALVCGASRGIGRATCFALAARGHELTLVARDAVALRALVEPLRRAGAPAVHAVPGDLDDLDATLALLRPHVARHPATVLVNNRAGPAAGPLLEASGAQILAALGGHLVAAHRLVQLVLPAMEQQHFGRIVQVLSTSVREPLPGLGVSNLVRAAVAAWAKTLSRELPPYVTINNVLPGGTETERLTKLFVAQAARDGRTVDEVRGDWLSPVPQGRFAQPEEQAEVVAFLCSPAASYVHGVSLPVDGGRLNSV